MSGDFYSRYVPPKPTLNHYSSSTLRPTSIFYERYIPSSSTAAPASSPAPILPCINERPTKRPKLGNQPKQQHNTQPLEKDDAPHTKNEPESQEGRDDNIAIPDDVTQPKSASPQDKAGDDPKHRRVREKFKKATERTEVANHAAGPERGEAEVSIVKHGLEPLPQPAIAEETVAHLMLPLPEWLANPICVPVGDEAQIPFGDLPLGTHSKSALEKHGLRIALPIQAMLIPMLVPGNPRYHTGDLCVSAATGSGKTLSYVLPLVEALRGKPVRLLRGLVVVPTRDLVGQVRQTLETYAAGSGLRIGIAVGNRTVAEEKAALLEKVEKYDPQAYRALQKRRTDPSIEDLMDWETDSDNGDEPTEDYVPNYVSAVDILICTPGRLVEHVRSTKDFTLDNVQWLIIDEADRLLDQNFQEWVETVMPALRATPSATQDLQSLCELLHLRRHRYVRKVILSATMTKDISKLLSLALVRPKYILQQDEAKPVMNGEHVGRKEYALPTTLREFAVPVGRNEEKPLVMVKLLENIIKATRSEAQRKVSKLEQNSSARKTTITALSEANSRSTSDSDSSTNTPSNEDSDESNSSVSSAGTGSQKLPQHMVMDGELKQSYCDTAVANSGVLIFVNTNEGALRLSRLLSLLMPEWVEIIGTISKPNASASRNTLAKFRSGKISMLIASDRASRGLDLKDLAYVVNYDIPTSLVNYIHRVGRTARAGKAGTAFSLVAYHEARWFWTEIGRSELLQRSSSQKVHRKEGLGKEVTEEQKTAYIKALHRLGEEAKGSSK